MIKKINSNIQNTPIVAIKRWVLSSISNDDLVIVDYPNNNWEDIFTNWELITQNWEDISANNSILFLARDATDYVDGVATLNSDCNIALNPQSNALVIYEEGISGSGFFTPSSEAQNRNGTYKRLIYSQIANSFYNNRRNPTQIFGMNNLDFELNKTNRIIGNQFLVFTIPQNIMGDKIVEGSVKMYDLDLDDNASIQDDRNGNLIIGNNLFSKIQEVRHIENIIQSGSSDNICS